jgi:hypothetical protein
VHAYDLATGDCATGDFAIVAVEGIKPDATITNDCGEEVIVPSFGG